MTSAVRVVLAGTLLAVFVLAGSSVPATAAETQFSLAVGQAVSLGEYTLVFRGLSGTVPVYDLYVGSVLAARLPSTMPPRNPAEYGYRNGSISIATTGAAPDGTAVSGILTVR
jgi:hypothetical protein